MSKIGTSAIDSTHFLLAFELEKIFVRIVNSKKPAILMVVYPGIFLKSLENYCS